MNSQQDPFSKWSKSISQPIENTNISSSQETIDPFSKWKSPNNEQNFPFEGENDLDREIERNQAQQTSRIGETILGLPGDLSNFVRGLFGDESESNLPTSQSLRQHSENASLGYTKPQNEAEERIGGVMQDVASFMLPGSGKYNLLRNIGIPVVANLAEEGLKYTGNEKLAAASKMGLMVGLDLLHLKGGGAKGHAGELFNESEKLVPKGATTFNPKLEKSMINLEKSLSSGGSAPSTEKALKKVSEIQSKMNHGEIEISELIDFRKNINEIKKELGGFDLNMPKAIKKKAIANLDIVKKEVINALDDYGTKRNPQFGKMNRSANEAFAVHEASDRAATFLKKTLKGAVKSPSTKAILGLTGLGAYHFPALAAKGALLAPPVAAGLYTGYESYKILHQVLMSPTLRKFYGNVLKGAISGNTAQVTKNAKALDRELIEMDQE